MSYKKENAWFIQEGKHGARRPVGSTKRLQPKKPSLSITPDIQQQMLINRLAYTAALEENKGLWLNVVSLE